MERIDATLNLSTQSHIERLIMATEDEEQQLYLTILKQPLDEFLEDLKNHNSEIKGKHRDALRLFLEDFYIKALNTLKEEQYPKTDISNSNNKRCTPPNH